MLDRLRRFKALCRMWKNYGADMNRRVTVENRLWAAAAGSKPPPTADECRELAIKLGVPDEYRSKR